MVMVALCLGLRVSELLVLTWPDFDFDRNVVRVTRAVVHGRIEGVKTEYSEDELPLDDDFARLLLDWQRQCRPTDAGWVFPSHINGQPYHASPIQQDYIRPAGCSLVRCPNCGAGSGTACHDAAGKAIAHHDERWAAAGSLGRLGWHTFRHTYRSWLDAAGAPMGVQQKLMRHAQNSTTMNIYGNAMMESKRDANSNVVRMALRLHPNVPKPQPEARHRMRRRVAAGSA